MNNDKNRASSILRDPIWQGVAALLGVVAFIISTIVAYDIYYKTSATAEVTDLTILNRYSYSLLDGINKSLEERVTILIDDIEIEHLVVEVFQLENTGNSPIPPNNYIEPIQISVEEPWEILSIEIGDTNPSDLHVNWIKVDSNTYQLEPLLLNSQDSVEFLVYLNRQGDFKELPEPSWSGRVVNVKSFTDAPPEIFQPTRTPFWFMQTIIVHSGWSIYFLVALALSLFIVGELIGTRSGRLSRSTLSRVILLTMIAGLSFSSADIVTDLVIPDDFIRFSGRMWTGSWILLILHLALLIYLGFPIIKAKILRKNNTL